MNIINSEKNLIKNWCSDIEPEAMNQIKNVANLPFIHNHVAVMPDAHAGKGSTVGTVIATRGAILPAAIGVDIGCGMLAAKLNVSIDRFENLDKLRHSIERAVPVGFNCHKEVNFEGGQHIFGEDVREWNKNDSKLYDKALLQVGTLGGGNHFIEISYDETNVAWMVLHSGSRNIGKTLAERHIGKAKGVMKQYFIDLPDPDLSYFVDGTPEFSAYIKDLLWAQDYAEFNRSYMAKLILEQITYHLFGDSVHKSFLDCNSESIINCHHNYCQKENHFGKNVWITRKGAVSAKMNEWVIIPGSMGTCTYICQGLGNTESFNSCSHGAGRKMSRTKARKTFTKEDLIVQTDGVECRKEEDIIDEIPGAYKDLNAVMNNQEDLVKIVHKLKPVLCIKG